MGIIKNVILILVILITLYIVWLFVFPEKTRSIWDYIWLQSFNDFVISFILVNIIDEISSYVNLFISPLYFISMISYDY